MHLLITGLAVVAGLFAIFWGFLCVAGALPVRTFARIELDPLEGNEARNLVSRTFRRGSWIDSSWPKENGFRPVGVFRALNLFGTPKVVAWQHEDEATWLCAYILPEGQFQIDFVSQLGDNWLTTGTTKDGHLFPSAEGKYIQTFTVKTADELWDLHNDAVEYLEDNRNVRVTTDNVDFAHTLETALKKQHAHITSIPLWFLRIPWWYFTRRNRLHGRTVEQQIG